ncbi:MAG: response regulator [Elusimicrobiota bacterium]
MKSKVLIIDDEKHILRTLEKLLQKDDYEVDTAIDYTKAVDKIKKDVYDLVILDHSLGTSEERDMVGDIKKSMPDCGIIMISGYFDEKEVKNYMSRGVYKCMNKPFTIYEVREAVRNYFDK